jgi:hypothetical protein
MSTQKEWALSAQMEEKHFLPAVQIQNTTEFQTSREAQNAVLNLGSQSEEQEVFPLPTFTARNQTIHGTKKLTLEAGHGGNLDGHRSGEVVHVEVQVRELGQLPNLPRNGALDAVVVEVQPLKTAKPGERRRQGAGEPAALQRDGRDAASAVALDAVEGATARVTGWIPGAEGTAGRVECPLERNERARVIPVARRGVEHRNEQEQDEEAEARGRHGSRKVEAPQREGEA